MTCVASASVSKAPAKIMGCGEFCSNLHICLATKLSWAMLCMALSAAALVVYQSWGFTALWVMMLLIFMFSHIGRWFCSLSAKKA
eukprot:CAMPEP_0206528692 /NCGR_PEP_ID=MMETSP0325_2-20121206/2132_1 /ASSEMBLY_ACC=CAM_ASM_000347 /TAXON_ID=2866 /ORGANISM="Crypthecodinium cohnii, Strain Seligo" /LENGTH=84 /DNA_ID=CAMNT_0054024415 /DNA_START=138 /DNA_END=392 /DNA_ORIENTATION=+